MAQIRREFPEKPKTRLMLAAGAGDLETMRIAIDQGENVNAQTEDQYSALHFAVANGHPEAVDLLLANGGDPNAATEFMYTPLHVAVFKGRSDLVAELLAGGAAPNVEDVFGKTPLHYAAASQHAPTVLTLLRGRARIIEASQEPWDLQATAYSYQALSTIRTSDGDPSGAREALTEAARYYRRADTAYGAERQRAEKELRSEAIRMAVATAAVVMAGGFAQAGAAYQAQSTAIRNAQMRALITTDQHHGNLQMYQRELGHEYAKVPEEAARLEQQSRVPGVTIDPAKLEASGGESKAVSLSGYIEEIKQSEAACEALAKRCADESSTGRVVIRRSFRKLLVGGWCTCFPGSGSTPSSLAF